jgi:hypothetical protein
MKRTLTSLMAIACLFASSKAFSQNPTTGNFTGGSACDLVVENFSTDPSTRGFTSSGLPWSGTQTSAQNLRQMNVTSNTDYIVTTPAYYINSGGTIRIGFTLSTPAGSNNYFANGNTFSLETQVLSSNGSTLLASYTASITAAGTYCIQLVDQDITAGTVARYRMIFTSSSSIGTSKVIEFDNFSTASNQQITLPVTFLSFTSAKSGTSNVLTWNISGELNVNRYEVERSGNGKTYSLIGSVSATLLSTYKYTDAAPLGAANYYRIKAVDNDGRFKYSPTVLIKSSTKTTTKLAAYPTVTTNTLTVEHDQYISGSGLQISSLDGRVVKRVIPGKDVQQTQVNVSSLTSGMYFIRYENSIGEVETMKFIKQ